MLHRRFVWSLAVSVTLFASACGGEIGGSENVCRMPAPPAEAVLPAGPDGANLILPGGRRITPTGRQTILRGYPAQVLLHPTIDVAIVNNVGYALRAMQVVRRSDGMLLQTLERSELWHGMELAPNGLELYVAGGDARDVQVFDVSPADGTLTFNRSLAINAYSAGIAVSTTANVLWTADFERARVLEVDRTTGAIVRSLTLADGGPFSVAKIPGKNDLYVSDARGQRIFVVDLTTFTLATTLDVGGGGPIGFEPTPDGSRVFLSVSDNDRVVAIDTSTRAIVVDRTLGEPELNDGEGNTLTATSPTGAAFDAANNRLYVARAADNVVAVLDGTTLAPQATIPTAWYPTDVALDGTDLVVTNGKGIGVGPTGLEGSGQPENKANMTGTLSSFDVATLDLAATTQQSMSNWQRPNEVYPADCGNRPHPVPTTPGGPTPIEHIILIVKENKSYDAVLGDLETGDADPSLVLWGEQVTPNAHAIAREFANHDNFYDDSESSVQGHFWLTYGFVNHYMEHISYLEDYRGNPGFGYDPAAPEGQPDFGSYFQHLIRQGIDFRVFGEVVGFAGMATRPDGVQTNVSEYVDFDFPGLFFNTGIKDETKANYLGATFMNGPLPQFSYVLLPNDHTNGMSSGSQTPRSMISDNDYGLGLLVSALSHHPDWPSTAIFIVEDDTQGCADHVDLHRSILLVASPWARRGETSHVHTSYPSLFRTFNHILGIPPLNRYDALATPLYDSFDTTPDFTPYDVRARQIPDELNGSRINKAIEVGMRWSDQMDFTVPDASPALGDILYLSAHGVAPPGSVLERVIAGEIPDPGPTSAEAEDDDEEEYERERAAAMRAIMRNPWLAARLPADVYAELRLMPR